MELDVAYEAQMKGANVIKIRQIGLVDFSEGIPTSITLINEALMAELNSNKKWQT